MALVKTLSDDLHIQVLGWKPIRVPNQVLRAALRDRPEHLQDLEDHCTPVDLPYPQGLGTVFEVLDKAVAAYGTRHLERLAQLAEVKPGPKPDRVPKASGWSRWDGKTWEKVSQPPDNQTYVLDFETGWVEDKELRWFPTIGVCWCLEEDCWYVWVSSGQMETTVPWGFGCTVAGHNVSYDRAYLSVEYNGDSGNRFYDTMSAWIAVRGMANQMRTAYKVTQGYGPGWTRETTTNGLDTIYKFYTGLDLDKGVRDLIVKYGYYWSLNRLDVVGQYAFDDIIATLRVFQHIYPEWVLHQPSQISQTAQLLIGSYWLPLSKDRWSGYADRAEATYQSIITGETQRLQAIAEDLVGRYLPTLLKVVSANPKVTAKTHPDLTNDQRKDLRAALKAEALETGMSEFYSNLPANLSWLDWTPSLSGAAKGYPAWYRSQYSTLSLKSRIVPALFEMTWRGQPILWGDLSRWGMETQGYYTEEYGPIEHPEDQGQRCTCLFSKGFEKYVENGTLASASGLTETLKAFMSTINWTSMRARIKGVHTESPEGFPVTLPQILPTGTITRRCTDKVWQVASNPKRHRIGTELKSMIEAPEGYVLVGADCDSQEVRLAGFLGDTELGYVGSSALSLVNLAGNKKDKTDVHSIAAKAGGVSRQEAKSYLTFSSLYGAGLACGTRGLMKGNPSASREECETKARAFMSGFKGQRSRDTKGWIGGVASYSFNVMDKIANSTLPTSPILKAVMPVPLRAAKKDFATTRTNWTIQTSGVDYRDLWVLLLSYLLEEFHIDGRVLMSIHDEVWSMCREDQKYTVAYIYQLVSLMVNAYIVDALGLDCIPAACAYHSAVNIDKVCRKGAAGEEYDPCITPSQPEAIPEGQELSVVEVIAALG